MKALIFTFLIAILVFGCQPKAEPVDTEAAKTAITELLNNLHTAMSSLDADTYVSYLADDGLFCGTDESEFWDKSGLKQVMTETFPDSIQSMDFSLDKREIRVAADGKSANVIEQYLKTDMFGPNLPMRIDYHLVNTNGTWMVNLMTMNFIPYNEDLPAIIGALNKEE